MTSTQITTYDDAYAKRAAKATQEEQLKGGTFISTRGGILKVGEQEMPGNQALVVILDWVRENTYYEGRFDPDNPMPPTCYAFARGVEQEEEMGPHPSMQDYPAYFKPQHSQCKGCPMNEWGSADKGRGKACQNRRRLTVLPAGVFIPRKGSRDFDIEAYDDVAHYEQADVAFMKLPVTSVENWAKYVNQVSAAVNRSPDGVFTRIFTEPHDKWQYTVNFEYLDKVPPELAAVMIRRADAAQAADMQGYMAPDPNAQQAPAGRQTVRNFRTTGGR